MIMGQHLVPGISLHAELEIAVPDRSRNALLNEPRRHMIIEFLTPLKHIPQGSKQSLWLPEKFRYRINQFFVIARLMPLDRRSDRRYDIFRAALRRQENLNAGARSFRCLDKNEFIFVRNDHRSGRIGQWLDTRSTLDNRKMVLCLSRPPDPTWRILSGWTVLKWQSKFMQRCSSNSSS